MARVRLRRFEVEEDALPSVCMKCGARAVVRKGHTFAWSPQWVAILLVLSFLFALALILPALILALIFTSRLRVATPLCARHQNYWLWRGLLIYGGLIVLAVVALVEVALLIVLWDEARGPIGLSCLGTGLCAVLWLFPAAVVQQSGIRVGEINDRGIVLYGVAEDFVEALEEERWQQAGDPYEEDRRPRRRRRLREEEDDRPRRRADEGYYDPDARPRRRPPNDEEDDR
jgi:hypothetical protein